MDRYEVIFWIPTAEDDDIETVPCTTREEAFSLLTSLCNANLQRVGFVFDISTNKRIMSIGVALD